MMIDSTRGRSGLDPVPGIQAARPAPSSPGPPPAQGERARVRATSTGDLRAPARGGLAALGFVAAFNKLMGDDVRQGRGVSTPTGGLDVSA